MIAQTIQFVQIQKADLSVSVTQDMKAMPESMALPVSISMNVIEEQIIAQQTQSVQTMRVVLSVRVLLDLKEMPE